MAKKKQQPSFWEDAYEQTVVVAKETDKLTALLEQNGQAELAEHIYTIFQCLGQAVRNQMPQDVRARIGERLEAEEQAAFMAQLEEFVASLSNEEVAELVGPEVAEVIAQREVA